MLKKWRLLKKIEQKDKLLFPEINPIILQILFNRGLQTQKEIGSFLAPDYTIDVNDPLKLPDVEKAVERIAGAVLKKEKILVYGDYDADGVCASAVMVSFLNALGTEAGIYIPYRDTEGYGMNMNAVREISLQKYNLVITVDCGITNAPEVDYFNKKGVDVIITDHHNPLQKIPKAYAVINPKLQEKKQYPNQELSGTAVAFKLVCAYVQESLKIKKYPKLPLGFEKWLLDLVAISLVSDVCKIKGENRTLLKYGLIVLEKTKRPGLRALLEISGIQKKIDSTVIGFQIAPRLNAAGRMDHASTSYHLLMSDDELRSKELALHLNEKNKERQSITEKMFQGALEQIVETDNKNILFAKHHEWTSGLVGLVAGKIAEKFYKPTLIVGKNLNGEWVGSGRSIPEFDITLGLKHCEKYLSHYGGHSQACGFTLKDEKSFAPFVRMISKFVDSKLHSKDLLPSLLIDSELEFENIDWRLFDDLKKLEPFGPENPKPRFLSPNVTVENVLPVGASKSHLRIEFISPSGLRKKTIAFQGNNEGRWGINWVDHLKLGDEFDIVYEIDVNEWNGNREIQLTLVDMKRHEK